MCEYSTVLPMDTVIRRKRFRRPSPAVANMLLSLADYQPAPAWPRDCRALANRIADAEPFTLVLFAEPLATEHWRRKIECQRRYDLPPPLGLWGTDAPQQFYFMRRSRTYERGCGSGSGTREAHSYFGLAFLELTRRGIAIPCDIFVYDKHNQLLLADTLPSFALYPGAMGSNCAEPEDTVQTLMQSASIVHPKEESDRSGIREIRVMAANGKNKVSCRTLPCR